MVLGLIQVCLEVYQTQRVTLIQVLRVQVLLSTRKQRLNNPAKTERCELESISNKQWNSGVRILGSGHRMIFTQGRAYNDYPSIYAKERENYLKLEELHKFN